MRSKLNIWRESASLIIAAKSKFNPPVPYDYKLLCLKRSAKSEFMPNTYVFPGGNISETDGSYKWLKIFEKSGHTIDAFQTLYPKENIPPILENNDDNSLPKYLSLRICAIRETFEECGILICRSHKTEYKSNTSNWASYIGGHEILKWQKKVHKDPEEFLNLCGEFDIYPNVWALKNWSNWVTPPVLPIRFNTMFFFSTFHQMPHGHAEEHEIAALKWASPDEYLLENINRKFMFPIPQYYEISRIRNFCDIESISKFASERSPYGCEKYCPYRISTKEGLFSIFPGDDLYPESMDMENTTVIKMDKIPDSKIKNRLLTPDEFKIKLFVENFVPKDRHLAPKSS